MPKLQDVSILIVDDDRVDVRGIRRGLQEQKISNPIFTARDGLEGLQMLRGEEGHPKLPRPFLILLDLNMPRVDGIEFLKRIREDDDLQNSIVFVLTTSNSDEDKVAAYAENIAGYVLKSNAGENFIDVVKMIEKFVLTIQFPPELE